MSKILAQRIVLATLPVFLLIGFKWSGLLGVGLGFIGWFLFRGWLNKTFYPETPTPTWELPVPPQTYAMLDEAKRNAEKKKSFNPQLPRFTGGLNGLMWLPTARN